METEDVDFIIDITVTRNQYDFETEMRELGFKNDTGSDAPICRWLMDFHGMSLKVDAMPTNENVFGFSNKWYRDSINTAWTSAIKEGLTIQVIDPVYFLGTKFEAFKNRGNGKIFSHDLEDVFYVLEHRSSIQTDVYDAKEDIRSYLATEFSNILKHPDLENTLPGLVDDSSSVEMVLNKMKFFEEKLSF